MERKPAPAGSSSCVPSKQCDSWTDKNYFIACGIHAEAIQWNVFGISFTIWILYLGFSITRLSLFLFWFMNSMAQSLVQKTVKDFCSVLASICHWSVCTVPQIQSSPMLDFFKIHSNITPTRLPISLLLSSLQVFNTFLIYPMRGTCATYVPWTSPP